MIDSEDERNRRSGENVLTLTYYEPLFPAEEIEEFRKRLNSINVKLSYGPMGPQASAVEIISHTLASTEVTRWIVEGAAWDMVSFFLLRFVQVIRHKLSSVKNTDAEPVHAIDFRVEERGVSFYLPVDSDPEVSKKALDTMVRLTKLYMEDKKLQKTPYDPTWKLVNGVWVAVDPSGQVL